MNTKESILKCIELAGGAKELASKVGVAYKTVLDWKNGRSGISHLNCIKIEKAVEGKVRREEIMPDYLWVQKDEKLDFAKNFLEAGIDKTVIAKAIGLSQEDIESIKI